MAPLPEPGVRVGLLASAIALSFEGRLGTAPSQIAVYDRYRVFDRSGDTSGNVFDIQVLL